MVLSADYKNGFLKGIFIFSGFVFAFFTYLVRCDTAVVSSAVVIIVWVFFSIQKIFKSQKLLRFILSSVFVCAVFAAGISVFSPSIYSTIPFLSKINSNIQAAFVKGRVVIVWNPFFSTLDMQTLFFGEGLIGRYSVFMKMYGAIFSFPFHNGYIEIFDEGGILFSAFYLFIVFVLLKRLWQIRKSNPSMFGTVLAASLGFMVYALAEAFTLTMDTSLMSAVPSFLLALAPTYYQKDSAYTKDVSI